jgi:hypothetical protein
MQLLNITFTRAAKGFNQSSCDEIDFKIQLAADFSSTDYYPQPFGIGVGELMYYLQMILFTIFSTIPLAVQLYRHQQQVDL